ncbi:MAG: polysaccharide export protein [Sphingomonadales bacterium]|nr:polysaccharide export protein [Sphingomonadales bacterium]
MHRIRQAPLFKLAMLGLLSVALSACASLGASGPSGKAIRHAGKQTYADGPIKVIALNHNVLERISSSRRVSNFSQIFGDSGPTHTTIGKGDTVDVAIWEAPPAVLFGVTTVDARLAANPMVAQSASIPQQMVGTDGTISIPFVGALYVDGKTTAQVQRDILSKLRGKAHDPQAVVRLVQNEARDVTIIGEVASSKRMPLSARGERLLDALASAGGPREPVGKTTVQLARSNVVATMPLEQIVRDPSENIRLQSADVITVLFQPHSFTALGAVTRSAEVPIEGSGINLAEALGRIGGLRDDRADLKGVFVFRMEQPAALDPASLIGAQQSLGGYVPVIYELDLSKPSSIFAAQDFRIENKDVIYVSVAPGADLQRFISAITNVAFTATAIGTAIP